MVLFAVNILLVAGLYRLGKLGQEVQATTPIPPALLLFVSGIIVIWLVITAWSGLCVSIKRCHDRNRSGWFLFIQLIPLVGPLWCLIELGFLPGSDRPNRFDDTSPWQAPQDRYAY